MSLFDNYVDAALRNAADLSVLRPVVEKELLHHDILREMSDAGLLKKLVFIGGTCLRACYGASRLSEDLDFTGGSDFDRRLLRDFSKSVVANLKKKYVLDVDVSEPHREDGNVSTWKLKIVTRPDRKDLPMQRINIDICSINSHDAHPVMLQNHYGVDMGTSGLIMLSQSKEEILADKIVAFALRPNRVKNRDLWDIVWLVQQGMTLPLNLIALKLIDRHCDKSEFNHLLQQRLQWLRANKSARQSFIDEMGRFLPFEIFKETVENPDFWTYLVSVVNDRVNETDRFLNGASTDGAFKM